MDELCREDLDLLFGDVIKKQGRLSQKNGPALYIDNIQFSQAISDIES